jgi:hypothetical protein
MIEMHKNYITRVGVPARILCVDRNHETHPVVALILWEMCEGADLSSIPNTFTADGFYESPENPSKYDLLEYNPWEDFKIDEPVLVRNAPNEEWRKRHFAGVENGVPTTWLSGATSWVSEGSASRVQWKECIKPDFSHYE